MRELFFKLFRDPILTPAFLSRLFPFRTSFI